MFFLYRLKSMELLDYQSPIGNLQLVAEEEFLCEIRFSDTLSGAGSENVVLKDAVSQLTEYFEGKRNIFDLPLKPEGTEFQQSVWNKLTEIPCGRTVTYLELANMIGDKNTIRAVGRANGQNPLPIVIPCHRVIGSEGKLVGYAGGIERKRWLLQHEGALLL